MYVYCIHSKNSKTYILKKNDITLLECYLETKC